MCRYLNPALPPRENPGIAAHGQEGFGLGEADAMIARVYMLDCYWVGSLDFNFFGNQGVLH